MFARLMRITGIAALLVIAACSPETRYRTLSFFFDGVPDPSKQAAETKKRGTAAAEAAAHQVRSHGPYAARMCDACHKADGVGLIMPVENLCQNCHVLNLGKKHVHGPVASGGCRACHDPHGSGKPFLLASDPTTFCFTCHDRKEIESREVHQAAAGTQCTECHNPHGSDNDYLLR